MRNFSVGVSFEVYSNLKKDWIDNLKFVDSLENVEHVELLLEYIPKQKEEVDFFKKLGKKYRIIVHATSLDLTLLSPNKEIVNASLEKLQQAYAFSAKIGAEVFTLHAGLMPKFWSEEKTLKNLKKGVKSLQRSKKLPVCVENMTEKWSIQIPYPCTVQHYKNVALFSFLTMDIGHFIKSGTDPFPILKQFSHKIYNIHLHNVHKGKDHLPLGKGQLNIPIFIDLLSRVKYDKFVTIEVVGREEIKASWKILQKSLKNS